MGSKQMVSITLTYPYPSSPTNKITITYNNLPTELSTNSPKPNSPDYKLNIQVFNYFNFTN